MAYGCFGSACGFGVKCMAMRRTANIPRKYQMYVFIAGSSFMRDLSKRRNAIISKINDMGCLLKGFINKKSQAHQSFFWLLTS